MFTRRGQAPREKRPLRVLHLLTSNARRGAEIDGWELADALGGDFVSQALALTDNHGHNDLPIVTLNGRWWSPQGLHELRAAMDRADVVVLHGSTTLPAGVAAGIGLAVDLIYRSIGDPWFWANNPRRRWQSVVLLRRVSFVASLTPSAAKAVQGCWKVDHNKVVVTGAGRDIEHFRPASASERRDARHSLGIPRDGPVVAFVGALSAEKRPLLALEVASLLPEVTFLIAGGGPLGEQVTEEAVMIGDRIRVLGQCEDVRDVFRATDVLLLTSATEGVPGVLIEAGLSGVPVVAPKVGFVPDVVEEGVSGFVVDMPAAERLASAVREAIIHKEAMGESARSLYVQRFDVRSVHERWRRLIRKAASAG